MSTLYNLGSINLDQFFRVPHLVRPGETLTATSTTEALGGKGINQSIAAHKAGADVVHIGAMGPNTPALLEDIRGYGLTTDHIYLLETHPTGTAIVAVDAAGENAIMLAPGANRAIPEAVILDILTRAKPSDWLVLQNETNGAEVAAKAAKARGMKIALSAAPFSETQVQALLDHVDLIAVNEDEARALEAMLGAPLTARLRPAFLVTKGADGAALIDGGYITEMPAFSVTPVDTTGAGDTYLGTYLAGISTGLEVDAALRRAAAAAAIQITREGAAPAIPDAAEVDVFLGQNA